MQTLTVTDNAHLVNMMTQQARILRDEGMPLEADALLARARSLRDATRHAMVDTPDRLH